MVSGRPPEMPDPMRAHALSSFLTLHSGHLSCLFRSCRLPNGPPQRVSRMGKTPTRGDPRRPSTRRIRPSQIQQSRMSTRSTQYSLHVFLGSRQRSRSNHRASSSSIRPRIRRSSSSSRARRSPSLLPRFPTLPNDFAHQLERSSHQFIKHRAHRSTHDQYERSDDPPGDRPAKIDTEPNIF